MQPRLLRSRSRRSRRFTLERLEERSLLALTVQVAHPILISLVNAVQGPSSTTLSDSAVLLDGNNETGEITFTLDLTTSQGTSQVDSVIDNVYGDGGYSAIYTPPTLGTGTYTWSAQYSGDNNNASAHDQGGTSEQVLSPIAINWNTPAPIVYGTALSGTQLNATATINGQTPSSQSTFSYATGAGTVLNAGQNTLDVEFTPYSNGNDYAPIFDSVSLDVTPATITIGNDTQTYGSPANLANDLGTTIAGVNGEILGITYSSTGDTATANVGMYAITGVVSDGTGLASNYDVTLTPGALTVNQAPISYSIGNDSQVYGSPANLANDLGTTIAGVNGESLGITYSSTGDTATANVGTYAITGAVSDGTGLASNYDVTLTPGALTVNQAPISYSIGNDSQVYGSPASFANDLGTTIAGVNGETLGITYSSTGDTATANVGTYAITGVVSDGTGLASNYDVTLTPGALTVNQAPISYSIGNDSQTYGSPANFANDLGTTIAGVNGETLGITYSSTGDTATANVGMYAITGVVSDGTGLASNYDVTLTPGALTVNQAPISYAIGNDSQVYGSPANFANDLGTTIAGVNGETLGITYSSTGDTATANVGMYAITGVVSDGTGLASNYDVTLTPGALTVNQAPISYAIGNDSQTYGSPANLANDLGTTIAGVNGESLGITYSSTGDTATANVGTYAITGVVSDGTGLASNYDVTLSPGALTVNQAPISYAIGNDSQTYGSPANLANDLGTTIAGVNGESLGITYSSTGDTATANVGTYAITGVVSDGTGLASNYDVTLTPGALTVNQAPISYSIGNDSQVYGSPASFANDLGTTIAGVNGETLGITYSSTGDTATANVGTYAITGAVSDGTGLASNYDVTLTPGALTVNQAPISYAIGNDSQTYGSPANFANDLGTTIAGVNGEILGITYSSTGDTATANVDTYAITGVVSDGTGLASNYDVTLTPGALTVNQAPISYTIGNDSQTYGSPANFANDLGTTIAGVNGEILGITYSSTGDTATANVDTYAITGVVSDGTGLASNYDVTLTPGALTVNQAPISYTIGNDSQIYGSPANLANDLGTTIAGVNGETLGIIYSSTGDTATANVDTYAITGAVSDGTGLASNYTVDLTNGKLTVNPAQITIAANNATKVYGAALPALTYTVTGLVNGNTLVNLPTITTTATSKSPAGIYTITASGATADSNYTIAYDTGTLVVTPVVLTVTANNATSVYGSTPVLAGVTYSGFVNGDSATSLTKQPTVSTTATKSSPVATYAITASDAVDPNYIFNYVTGTLNVTPAALKITANHATKSYGAALPPLNVSYSGFVNGDSATSLTKQPTVSTTATKSSPVATYAITASDAVDPNYIFNYVTGTLNVTPAALKITANHATKSYGAALPPLNVSYSGFVNGDTSGSLTTQPTVTTTATQSSNVGSYRITASGAADSNYTFTYVPSTLTITPVLLVITANPATKVYGSANPTFTVSYSGFVNGDTASSLTKQPTVTTRATQSSSVGTYSLVPSGAVDSNYTVVYVDGVLTITPKS